MLALIGFTISGLLLFSFAQTFQARINTPAKLGLDGFAWGYALLGAAFSIWGIGSIFGGHQLVASIIIGDVLLLGASTALASVISPLKYRTLVYAVGGAASVLLGVIRYYSYYPTPRLSHGVLLFNTQRPVGLLIGCLLALIWLPASAVAAKKVAASMREPQLYNMLTGLYVVAVLSALMFLAARQVLTAVLSFSILTVSFALLTTSNYFVAKIQKANHAK